jgi:hypothetical protein
VSVGPEQDAINANHEVALQKPAESAGLSTGRHYFGGVARMDRVELVYAVMVAVGLIGFVTTLVWMAAS